WQLARIHLAEITENVVDLLSRSIRKLPEREQEMLGVAACVGNELSLGLLAGVLAEPLDRVASALWGPIHEGLLVPKRGGARFDWAGSRPVELASAVAPTYRFVHDRVQEAAYQLLGAAKRESLHLQVGRWLLDHVPASAFDDAVCSIVDQLDRARGH